MPSPTDPTHLVQELSSGTETLRVAIMTRELALIGTMHIPKTGKDARRLSNLLNGDRRFVAMTQVEIMDRSSGRVNMFLIRKDWSSATTGASESARYDGPERRLTPRLSGGQTHAFIEVNVEAIELLIPLDE